MTITLCGSMKFIKEMDTLKKKLENLGCKVFSPAEEDTDTDYSKLSSKEQADQKQNFIDDHIEKIKKSDAILLANYEKHEIKDYIGANTFLEMAFAYLLKKKIFILNKIPQQPNNLEMSSLKPIVLNGRLNSLKKYL